MNEKVTFTATDPEKAVIIAEKRVLKSDRWSTPEIIRAAVFNENGEVIRIPVKTANPGGIVQ